MRLVINNIALSSTGPTVTAHLDSVITTSPATGRRRCPIDEIRRVDYRRMMADLRARAQAQPQAQPQPPAPPPPQAH